MVKFKKYMKLNSELLSDIYKSYTPSQLEKDYCSEHNLIEVKHIKI